MLLINLNCLIADHQRHKICIKFAGNSYVIIQLCMASILCCKEMDAECNKLVTVEFN